MKASPGSILMVVENRFPYDLRVANEAKALTAAGYAVSVICLRSKTDKGRENVGGIDVYRLPRLTLFKKTSAPDSSVVSRLRSAVQSVLGYMIEYAYFTIGSLLLSLYVCAKKRIHVVHLHNPPDTLFIVAALHKLLGKKIVFDHHDLSPELYLSRYNKPRDAPGPIYRTLRLFESFCLRLADLVIATNESYRDIDIRRGKVDPRRVFVVRNGPDLTRMRLTEPDDRLRALRKSVLVYIGVMGPQDGVDYLLRALRHLVYDLDKLSFYCVIIGTGDAVDDLKRLAHELRIDDYVWFTGFIPEQDLLRYLSTADICVAPDPSSPLNDVSTWIKIMEYMALGKPIVSFDLKESRYSAQDAALYVRPNDELEFARAIETLMARPDLRRKMGEVGRMRIEKELKWDLVKENLVSAYRTLSRR
jgi:glycosyltransferase involved in cell wall biosynthesis